jgi:GT2 family glycosyltransferase
MNSSYAVIVLYYKLGPSVVETIRRVLQQTLKPTKILVYDNGSRDDVCRTLADTDLDGTVEFVISNTNRGYAGGMNAARRHLGGDVDYHLLLTHEVWLESDCAERLVTYANRQVKPCIVGPAISRKYTSDIWSCGGQVDAFGRLSHALDPTVQVQWLDGCCLLIPSRLQQEFEESFFLYVEDVEYCLRARDHGLSVFVTSDARASQDTSTQPIYYECRNTPILWRRQRQPLKLVSTYIRLLLKTALKANSSQREAALRGLKDSLSYQLAVGELTTRTW